MTKEIDTTNLASEAREYVTEERSDGYITNNSEIAKKILEMLNIPTKDTCEVTITIAADALVTVNRKYFPRG